MSESWLAFFEKWLKANLLFEGAPGPRARARGVPIAHALSVSGLLYNPFIRDHALISDPVPHIGTLR